MAEKEPLISVADVARLFGVETRTVTSWQAAGAPHRKRSGRVWFQAPEIIQWRRTQDRLDSRPPGDIDEAKERARKMRADADLAEQKLKVQSGDLVPAADVQQAMERRDYATRARVLGIRGKFAPRVIGLGTMAEATVALDAIVSDILSSLRESADDLDDPDADEGA